MASLASSVEECSASASLRDGSGGALARRGRRASPRLLSKNADHYWGATLCGSVALRTLLAIVIALGVALVWGLFISPKARYPTGRPGQVGLGLIVFLVAALLLRERGHLALAVGFAVIALVSSALLDFLPP
jgi:hypothetical protein